MFEVPPERFARGCTQDAGWPPDEPAPPTRGPVTPGGQPVPNLPPREPAAPREAAPLFRAAQPPPDALTLVRCPVDDQLHWVPPAEILAAPLTDCVRTLCGRRVGGQPAPLKPTSGAGICLSCIDQRARELGS
ncbi:MAG: hypothetical protein ACRDTZ_07995 [Pseudonocardiaceae bacterium]